MAFFDVVFLSGTIAGASGITYDVSGTMPQSLSGDEFIIVRDTALSDDRVQNIIDGNNYVITDCCGFHKTNETSKWQPVINIGISNGMQLVIAVDLDSRKVTATEQADFSRKGPIENDSTESGNSWGAFANISFYSAAGIGAAAAIAAFA